MSSPGNVGEIVEESLGSPDVIVTVPAEISSSEHSVGLPRDMEVEAVLAAGEEDDLDPPSPRLDLRRGRAHENLDDVMMATPPATGGDVAEGPLPVAHTDEGNGGSTSTDMDLDVEPGPSPTSQSSSPSDPNIIPVAHSQGPLPDPSPAGGRFLTVTFVSTSWDQVTVDREGRVGPTARANSSHRVMSHVHGGW